MSLALCPRSRIAPTAFIVAAGFVARPAYAQLTAQSERGATGLKPMPSSDSLAAISERGRLLAQYDFVAWYTTDSVMARRPAAGAIETYVAHREPSGRWAIAFGRMNGARDTLWIAYEARQREANPESFDVTAFPTPRADTGYYLRAARAVEVAKSDFVPMQHSYNAAVLERAGGGLWVYFIPAQTRLDVFPLGADVRYQMSADGRSIIVKRPLHRAVIEFSGARAANGGAGNRLTAATHTAILDDIPEDTDVFHVLVRRPQVPEYIVTDAFVYSISVDGNIRLLGRREAILGKDSAGTRTAKIP
jgi:hypothetical protein